MQAINLYLFSQIHYDKCMEYEAMLSKRDEKRKIKEYEFQSVLSLVNLLVESGAKMECFEGFYFSYCIDHISKEFDLLKIKKNEKVLNVELKSNTVSEDKIKNQLKQNRYYLTHLGTDIFLYTYIKDTQTLYTLENDILRECNVEELIECMNEFDFYEKGDIKDLFRAKDFLISPLNTPEKFMNGSYFLTQQQQEIEEEIMKRAYAGYCENKWGITGNAGTGKTLLLYDIAKKCSQYGRCCIVHCGILCDGHKVLNQALNNVDIYSAKEIVSIDLSSYRYVFVDETQRIYSSILENLIDMTKRLNIFTVFSYDINQILSKKEKNRNIIEKLYCLDNYKEKILSDKIRTNKEISSFIRNLIDLNDRAKRKHSYEDIDILYAKDVVNAKKIINLYQKKRKYVFISYTQSQYIGNVIDKYNGDYNTHQVIGQEFDNVLIVLDINFRYSEDGRLQGKDHPNPDYIFHKLFYQGVSRTREKLCILVVENIELFDKIISIKENNL